MDSADAGVADDAGDADVADVTDAGDGDGADVTDAGDADDADVTDAGDADDADVTAGELAMVTMLTLWLFCRRAGGAVYGPHRSDSGGDRLHSGGSVAAPRHAGR